jgi:hypothetical protein
MVRVIARSPRALLFLSCFVLLAGCGDDGSASDGGSAGTGGDGDGDGDGGDGDGDGDGESCTIPPREVTEATEQTLSNLSVSGDKLAFISSEPATLFGTIEVIGIDGEGQETLHSPEGQRRVRSVMAHGDTVYFLEKNEEIVSRFELFSVPLAGGTAERIGDGGIETGAIFGIDDSHVFTVRDHIIERFAIDGGALERVGSLAGASLSNLRLSGDDIFFAAGTERGAMHGVYRLDKAGTDAEPEKLWDIPQQDDPCYIILGGLFATPTKLVCGYFSLAARDRDGTMEDILFDGDVLTGLRIPFAVDGEDVYYGGYQEVRSPLSRMTSAGEDVEVLACDTGRIAHKLLDAFFPMANTFEVVVGDSDVFWIEQDPGDDEAPPTHKIRAATK